MNKKKKILFVAVGVVILNSLIVFVTINHAKSKVSQHIDENVKLSGLTLTNNFYLGLTFKKEKNFSFQEYVYTLPEGDIFTRYNGSKYLIRSEKQD